MKKIKFFAALWVSKAVLLLCNLLKSRGSTTPGRIALKICPDFITVSAKKVKEKIILVCGTNGKTTTNNLINSALEKAGYVTVCNKDGANMLSGIAAAFSKSMSFFGKMNADFACLEVDEANMPLLLKRLTPDIVAVSNLFRDQLDRYGEIDITANLLKKAFLLAPQATLVLNADDPVTSVFENKAKNVYYSICENPNMLFCNEIRDGSSCPKCGFALDYKYYNYGQLGRYVCKNCGYENPKALYNAKNIEIKDGVLSFRIDKGSDGEIDIKSSITGLYHVYNMLLAYSVCDILKIDSKITAAVFEKRKPEPGRMSRFDINGKCIYLILSKNPTGFNQSVTTVINDKRQKDICLVLNDNAQDGIDISWIYDVDFETMIKTNAASYTVTGIRKYDMYLRIKYAGADEKKMSVSDTIPSAIDYMIENGTCDVCYVLVNYTAMYPAYLHLTQLEKEDIKNG